MDGQAIGRGLSWRAMQRVRRSHAFNGMHCAGRLRLICVLLAVRTVIQFQDEYPWFLSGNQFVGDRASDVHLTNAMKRATTDQARGK